MKQSTRRWWRRALWVGSGVVVFVACGSDDAKKKSPDKPYLGDAGDGGSGSPVSAGAGGTDVAPSSSGAAGDGPMQPSDAGAAGAETGTAGARETPGGGGEGGVLGAAGAAQAGAGGEAPVQVFSSTTALFDAIDAGTIVEGEAWRVEWIADARASAGSFSGVIDQGAPEPSVLDHGPLPLKLVLPSDWVQRFGSLSFDADGYPTLSLATGAANASAGASLVESRYAFRRFSQARLRVVQDVTGAAPLSGVSFQLITDDLQSRLVGNHFVEVGGASQSVAIDYYNAGVQVLTSGVGTAAHGRAFEGYWNLLVANPASPNLAVSMRLDTLQNQALGTDTSPIVGHGDWSMDAGVDYVPMLGLYRAAGGSGTSTAVGVSFEVTRYAP